MTEAEKLAAAIRTLTEIATAPDPSPDNRRSYDGQFRRFRTLAKMTLKQIGVPPAGSGHGSHPLHYNDISREGN